MILLAVFFGIPVYMLVRYLLEVFGVIKPDTSQRNKNKRSSRRHDDDFFRLSFSEEAEALRVAASLAGSFGGGFLWRRRSRRRMVSLGRLGRTWRVVY